MPRVSFTVSDMMYARLEREARRRRITVPELMNRILWGKTWKPRRGKSHWLVELYARGAPKRQVRSVQDWYSDGKRLRRVDRLEDWFAR